MPGTDPFEDIESAPVAVDGGDDRASVVDWRMALVVLIALCCVAFSWLNWESVVTVRLLFCGDVPMSVMVVILVSLATGFVSALIMQAGYRRWKDMRRELEERAAAGDEPIDEDDE